MSQLLDHLLHQAPGIPSLEPLGPTAPSTENLTTPPAGLRPPRLPQAGIWLFGLAAAVASVSPAAVLLWQDQRPAPLAAVARPAASPSVALPTASAPTPTEATLPLTPLAPTGPIEPAPPARQAHPLPEPPADLHEAYAALQRGDEGRAAVIYRRRLAQVPTERDARLGLAALAVRQGQFDKAQADYRALLADFPDDPVALAALATLDEAIEPERLGRIKQGEAAAAVALSLGNRAADAGDWSMARRHYAQALELAPDHPDAAFNLAISLDHLPDPAAAARFYRQALDTARHRPFSFTLPVVRQRLAQLAEAGVQDEPAQDLSLSIAKEVR
ncbi:tetratricopeptide repeat protein [Chitinimonas lacunae]|uniref:Tetratricopeptide repeat protein n=1 Tax=Chitinimonas lacunae TaxID=1963018 RepID=A0ABV8MQ01_9NEIS